MQKAEGRMQKVRRLKTLITIGDWCCQPRQAGMPALLGFLEAGVFLDEFLLTVAREGDG
jgi:hypothetical protein